MANPICTFFINNNCRFGNQCKKEHIDVRLLVKTDIDGVIKGNQWPLSVYGPFKDKPNIPQFIEDQSFEELRSAAYDAKAKGTFPAYAAEVAQRFGDAKHRMGQLYELNMESLKVIVDMYNSNLSDSGNQFGASRPNNPFTKINNMSTPSTNNNAFGAKPSNPFGSTAGNSIFGNNSASAPTANIFGATPSVFGGGPSVFGGDNNASSQQPFGVASQPSAFNTVSNTTSNNIFAQPSVSTNNIFGNNSFGASTGSNVFGGAATFSTQPASIFGGGAAAAQPAAGSSIFGQPSSVFGGGGTSTTSNNVFGSNPNTISTASSSNIFGQPSTTTQQQSSIFGVPPDNQNVFGNNTSMFGNSQLQQPSNNIFGQPSTSDAIVPNQPTNNAFGLSSSAHQPSNAFGVPVQSSNDNNAFGNNYQSPFGAPQPQQQQQQQPISSFGVPPSSMASSNDPFHNSRQLSSGMGSVDPMEDCFYTKKELLSAEELAAFNADTFDLATIPARPPPRELCA